MKKRNTYNAHVIGAIQQTELQIGMYLTNDGPGTIPVYPNKDGTGTAELTISPGELIGQIVDFSNGPTGMVVYFTSDAITAASSIFDKIGNYILSFIPGQPIVNAGAVNFTDLQSNIDESQINKQQTAINNAAAQGATLANSIKKVAKETGDVIGGVFKGLWPVVLIGAGLWLVTHSSFKGKKFSYKS